MPVVHEIPAGELVTVPVAPPESDTVVESVACEAKFAVTNAFAFITTVHVPVPVQAPPLHPVNTLPLAGDAVKVTLVPELKLTEHVAPQLIPAGELVTVPLPVPAFDTDSVN